MSIEVEWEEPIVNDQCVRRVVPAEDWIFWKIELSEHRQRQLSVIRLVAFLAQEWLKENPQRVNEIAKCIECTGRNHRIVDTPKSD